MGLLEDIWAGIRGKIEWLIHSIVDPIVNRINEGIKQIADWVTGVESAWEHFTSKTLPDLWTAIQEASATFVEYVENVYHVTEEYITNTYNTFTEVIHNTFHTTKEYITNVIGVSEEWVRNYVAGLINPDFLKDPLGYLNGAFLRFIDPWVQGILNSMAEGAEEWFRELEEAEGPG